MDQSRRNLLKYSLFAPAIFGLLRNPQASVPAALSIEKLKAAYSTRLKRILNAGHLPYIDLESSCNPNKLDISDIAQMMDELNIGLMALSADPGKGQFAKGIRYDKLVDRLVEAYPDRFIPVGNGGQPPFTTEASESFLAAQEQAAIETPLLTLGEFEFRHYPSPRQVKRGNFERDVSIPIDGPLGHRLFSLAEKLNIPFLLHYEIEDELLPPLERMLAQYPKAKVIWCHLAQIRYIERAPHYSAQYIDQLLTRFQSLYFDTAFGDPMSVYPLSNQRQARIWDAAGRVETEWVDVMLAHSEHFLSALDLGGDRMEKIVEYDRRQRSFLGQLPQELQHHVAYKNAWRLLFSEEFA